MTLLQACRAIRLDRTSVTIYNRKCELIYLDTACNLFIHANREMLLADVLDYDHTGNDLIVILDTEKGVD